MFAWMWLALPFCAGEVQEVQEDVSVLELSLVQLVVIFMYIYLLIYSIIYLFIDLFINSFLNLCYRHAIILIF